jgi:hypothetical protein
MSLKEKKWDNRGNCYGLFYINITETLKKNQRTGLTLTIPLVLLRQWPHNSGGVGQGLGQGVEQGGAKKMRQMNVKWPKKAK